MTEIVKLHEGSKNLNLILLSIKGENRDKEEILPREQYSEMSGQFTLLLTAAWYMPVAKIVLKYYKIRSMLDYMLTECDLI